MNIALIFDSTEDIELHINALNRLAMADNDFDPRVKQYIQSVAKSYSVFYPSFSSEKCLETTLSGDEFNKALEKIKTSPVRSRMLLKDLIVLGHVDGHYTDDEKELVSQIGQKLDIASDIVKELEVCIKNMLDDVNKINFVIYGTTVGESGCINA